MSCKEIDAIVIGFTSQAQIDEAIERMNRRLKDFPETIPALNP